MTEGTRLYDNARRQAPGGEMTPTRRVASRPGFAKAWNAPRMIPMMPPRFAPTRPAARRKGGVRLSPKPVLTTSPDTAPPCPDAKVTHGFVADTHHGFAPAAPAPIRSVPSAVVSAGTSKRRPPDPRGGEIRAIARQAHRGINNPPQGRTDNLRALGPEQVGQPAPGIYGSSNESFMTRDGRIHIAACGNRCGHPCLTRWPAITGAAIPPGR